MCRARIKLWNMRQGFGFATLKNGKDALIHWKDVERHGEDYVCLNIDELVEFDLEENNKGYKALNVKRINEQRKINRTMDLGGIQCVN